MVDPDEHLDKASGPLSHIPALPDLEPRFFGFADGPDPENGRWDEPIILEPSRNICDQNVFEADSTPDPAPKRTHS